MLAECITLTMNSCVFSCSVWQQSKARYSSTRVLVVKPIPAARVAQNANHVMQVPIINSAYLLALAACIADNKISATWTRTCPSSNLEKWTFTATCQLSGGASGATIEAPASAFTAYANAHPTTRSTGTCNAPTDAPWAASAKAGKLRCYQGASLGTSNPASANLKLKADFWIDTTNNNIFICSAAGPSAAYDCYCSLPQ